MADQVNCRECVHFGSAGSYPLWCHAKQFSLQDEHNVTSGRCIVFTSRPPALFRCYNCKGEFDAGMVSPEGLCIPCQSVTNVSDEPEEVLYSSMPVAPVAGDWSSTAAATAEANARGEGYKADSEKRDWTILPWESLEDVVKVLEAGARKYARDNWQRVPDGGPRYIRAAFRHLVARARGEVLDADTGLPHLACAGCCVLFAAWFDKHEASQP
jgi:hypothetical protein